ncbi:MAG: ABC transporter permease [Anaerolineae bacterium]
MLALWLLMVWELAGRARWISALFFPAPSALLMTLARLMADGTLAANLSATLSRVLMGFVLGGIPGLLLGLAMGWSRRLRAIADPFVAAVHPLPKVAMLPLIMVIFGIGEAPKVVVIALAAFFPLLIDTMAGVRQINPIYFEVAKNYGAGVAKVFARVVLPGSLPLVLSGVRQSLNTALLLAIAVEMVSAQRGLGAMVWFGWETLRVEQIYVALAVTAALGVSSNVLLRGLAAFLAPWQVEGGKS